jgi:hypothetical protein
MKPVRIYEIEFTPLPGCDFWGGEVPDFNCFTFAYLPENEDWEDREWLADWADTHKVSINSAELVAAIPADEAPFDDNDERADHLAFAREHGGIAFSPFFGEQRAFDSSTVRFSDAIIEISPTPEREDWPADAESGFVRVKTAAETDEASSAIIQLWAASEHFDVLDIEFDEPFRYAPEPRWPDEDDEFTVAVIETPSGTTFAYVGLIHLHDGSDED